MKFCVYRENPFIPHEMLIEGFPRQSEPRLIAVVWLHEKSGKGDDINFAVEVVVKGIGGDRSTSEFDGADWRGEPHRNIPS